MGVLSYAFKQDEQGRVILPQSVEQMLTHVSSLPPKRPISPPQGDLLMPTPRRSQWEKTENGSWIRDVPPPKRSLARIQLQPFPSPEQIAPPQQWSDPSEREKALSIHQRMEAIAEVQGGKTPGQAMLRLPEFNQALREGTIDLAKIGQAEGILEESRTGKNRDDRQMADQVRNLARVQEGEPHQWTITPQEMPTRSEYQEQLLASKDSISAWFEQTARNASRQTGREVTPQELHQFVPNLSHEQLRAITSKAQVTSTFAGAGGGKSTQMVAQFLDDVINRGGTPNTYQFLSKTHSAVENIRDMLQGVETLMPHWNQDPERKDRQFRTLDALGLSLLTQKEQGTTPLERLGLGQFQPLYQGSGGKSGRGVKIIQDVLEQSHQHATREYLEKVMRHYEINPRFNNSQDLDAYITQSKAEKGSGLFHERFARGKAIYETGHEWKSDAQVQAVHPDLALYLYVQSMQRQKGFEMKEQKHPLFDINDVPWLVQRAVEKGQIAPLHRYLVDEVQDSSPSQIGMMRALTGQETRGFLAGDMGQKAIQNRWKIDQNILQQFAERASHHTLTANNRSGPYTTSTLNALNEIELMSDVPKSPFQVAMGKMDAPPTVRTEADFPQLYRGMIHDWMKLQGTSPATMKEKMDAGQHPLEGLTYPAQRVPFAFQIARSGKGVPVFKQTFREILSEHDFSPEQVQGFMDKYVTEETPTAENRDKIHAMKIAQLRSRDVDHLFGDVTRGGKWDAVGYIQNLYTMLSRAKEQNHLYASQTNYPGSQYKLEPADFLGEAVPPGFSVLLQEMARNAHKVQQVPVEDFPAGRLRTALSLSFPGYGGSEEEEEGRPGGGSPIDLALTNRALEEMIFLNKYYESPVGTDSGIKETYGPEGQVEKIHLGDDRQVIKDLQTTSRMSAANVAGQYKRGGDTTKLQLSLRAIQSLLSQGNLGDREPVPGMEAFLEAMDTLNGRVKIDYEDVDFLPSGKEIRTPFDPTSMYPASHVIEQYDVEKKEFAPRDSQTYQGRDDHQLQQSLLGFLEKPEAMAHPVVQSLLQDQWTHPRLIKDVGRIAKALAQRKRPEMARLQKYLDLGQTPRPQVDAWQEELEKFTKSQDPLTQEQKKRQAQLTSMLRYTGEGGLNQTMQAVMSPSHELNKGGKQGGQPSLHNTWLAGIVEEKTRELLAKGHIEPHLMEQLAVVAEQIADGTEHPTNKQYFLQKARTFRAYQGYSLDKEGGSTLTREDVERLKQEKPFEGRVIEKMFGEQISQHGSVKMEHLSGEIAKFVYHQGAVLRGIKTPQMGQLLGVPLHISRLAPAITEFRAYASSLEGGVEGHRGGIVDPMALAARPLHKDAYASSQDEDFSFQQYGAGVTLSNYEKRLQEMLAPKSGVMQETHREDLARQLEDVRQIRSTIHNPLWQLQSAQLMQGVLRATTGEAVMNVEKEKDEGTGSLRRDPISTFFSQRKNDYREGMRTLSSLKQFIAVLSEASAHVEQTGTLKRSHLLSILEQFGHSPDDPRFGALRLLEQKHGFRSTREHPDPSLHFGTLVNQFRGEEQRDAAAQLNRVPLLPGVQYRFTAKGKALSKKQEEMGQLSAGMEGTLTSPGKMDFGLSKDQRIHRNRGVIPQHSFLAQKEMADHAPASPIMNLQVPGSEEGALSSFPVVPEQLMLVPGQDLTQGQLPWHSPNRPQVLGPYPGQKEREATRLQQQEEQHRRQQEELPPLTLTQQFEQRRIEEQALLHERGFALFQTPTSQGKLERIPLKRVLAHLRRGGTFQHLPITTQRGAQQMAQGKFFDARTEEAVRQELMERGQLHPPLPLPSQAQSRAAREEYEQREALGHAWRTWLPRGEGLQAKKTRGQAGPSASYQEYLAHLAQQRSASTPRKPGTRPGFNSAPATMRLVPPYRQRKIFSGKEEKEKTPPPVTLPAAPLPEVHEEPSRALVPAPGTDLLPPPAPVAASDAFPFPEPNFTMSLGGGLAPLPEVMPMPAPVVSGLLPLEAVSLLSQPAPVARDEARSGGDASSSLPSYAHQQLFEHSLLPPSEVLDQWMQDAPSHSAMSEEGLSPFLFPEELETISPGDMTGYQAPFFSRQQMAQALSGRVLSIQDMGTPQSPAPSSPPPPPPDIREGTFREEGRKLLLPAPSTTETPPHATPHEEVPEEHFSLLSSLRKSRLAPSLGMVLTRGRYPRPTFGPHPSRGEDAPLAAPPDLSEREVRAIMKQQRLQAAPKNVLPFIAHLSPSPMKLVGVAGPKKPVSRQPWLAQKRLPNVPAGPPRPIPLRGGQGGKLQPANFLQARVRQSKQPWYQLQKGLSPEQQGVFDDQSQHLLVQGGPGSGKSSTFVKKMGEMILRQGLKPEKVVTVSPMHSGVEALNKQYNETLRPMIPQRPGAGGLRDARTIHGLAHDVMFGGGDLDEQTGKMVYPNLEKIGMGHIQGILADVSEEELLRNSPESNNLLLRQGTVPFLQEALSPHPVDIPSKKKLGDFLKDIGNYKKGRMEAGSEYQEAMQVGPEHLKAGLVTKQAALAAYQQHMGKEGLIDFDDYPILGAQVLQQQGAKALPSSLQGLQLLGIDEAQDTTPAAMNFFEQVVKAVGGGTRMLVGMDPMQGLLEDLGAIAPGKVVDAYKGLFGRVGGTSAHHQLNTNFRSDKAAVALNNAILRTKTMKKEKGVSALQVPHAGSQMGKKENITLANSDVSLNQRMFRSMMASTGVDKQAIAANLQAGKGAFEGVDWSQPGLTKPSEIPGIFLTKNRRDFFKYMASKTLQKDYGLNDVQGDTAIKEMMRHGVPGLRLSEQTREAAETQFPLGTPSQFRGLQFEQPHMDVTRTGAWWNDNKLVSYFRNLFVGVSRVKEGGQNSLFATDRPFQPWQQTMYKRSAPFVESEPHVPGAGVVQIGTGRKSILTPSEATKFGKVNGQPVPNGVFQELLPLRDKELAAGTPPPASTNNAAPQPLTLALPPGGQVSIQATNPLITIPGGQVSAPSSPHPTAAPSSSPPSPTSPHIPAPSSAFWSAGGPPPNPSEEDEPNLLTGPTPSLRKGWFRSPFSSRKRMRGGGGPLLPGTKPEDPDEDEDKKKKKGSGSSGSGSGGVGGLNNLASNFGRTLARLGYEMQFVGKLFDQITTAAVTQGSAYRRASLSLSGTPGSPTGDAGFFNFTHPQSGISQMSSQFPMYSKVQIAQSLKEQASLTGSTRVPTAGTSSILALSALSGVDPTQLTAEMGTITGSMGAGKSQYATQRLAGMISGLYHGNLSSLNVLPTLQATSSVLPTLQGVNLGGSSQLESLMGIFKAAIDSGMTSQNLPGVAQTVGSLAQMGTTPDLAGQQFLAQLFPGQTTANPQLMEYQKGQVEMSGQIQQMQLQQSQIPQQMSISDADLSIQQANLQLSGQELGLQQQSLNLDKAELNIQQANLTLDMKSLTLQQQDQALNQQSLGLSREQLSLSQAGFQHGLAQQEAQYGPIGADVSRESYFSFMRNQQAAGYNPLSAETGTQFKSSPVFGIENAKFYAGVEHQRQDLVLSRSSLLSDARFQENQKYLNEQEAFYKEELKVRNDDRTFQKDSQQKNLAIQSKQLDIQQSHLTISKQQLALSAQRLALSQQGLTISKARLGLSGQQLGIAQKRYALDQQRYGLDVQRNQMQNAQLSLQAKLLPQQIAAIQNLQRAMQQYASGQGPVGGKNVTPEDIIRQLSTITNDARLKQTIQMSRLSPADQNILYQLIKQVQHEGGFDKVQASNAQNDKALMKKLDDLVKGGAFADQTSNAALQDAFLNFGGQGGTWMAFVQKFDEANKNWKDIATQTAFLNATMKDLATKLETLGPIVVAIGTLLNGIGLGQAGIGFIKGGGLAKAAPLVGAAGKTVGTGIGTFLESGVGAVAIPLAIAAGGAFLTKWLGDQFQSGLNKEAAHPGSAQIQLPSWMDWAKSPTYDANLKKMQLQNEQYRQAHGGKAPPVANDSNNMLINQLISGATTLFTKTIPGGFTTLIGGVGQKWNDMVKGSGAYFKNVGMDVGTWWHNQITSTGKYWQNVGFNVADWWRTQGSQMIGSTGASWHNQIASTGKYWRDIGSNIEDWWRLQGSQMMGNTGAAWNNQIASIGKYWRDVGFTIADWWRLQGSHMMDGMGAGWNALMGGMGNSWNKQIITPIFNFFTKTLPNSINTALSHINLNPFGGGAGGPAVAGGGAPAGFSTPNVNTQFGAQMWYGKHQGVDFAAAQGTPLSSFDGGTVTGAGFHPWGGEVDISIGGGLTERYLHLSQISVHDGQQVGRGSFLGLTGGGTVASGLGYWSSGAHSHVQIDRGDINAGINPWPIWNLLGDHNLLQYYQSRGGSADFANGGFAGNPRGTKPERRDTWLSTPASPRHLAIGGIAMTPTYVQVAEQEAEAIVPLSKLSELLKGLPSSSLNCPHGVGGGGTSSLTQKAGVVIQNLIGQAHFSVTTGTGGTLSEQEQDRLMSQLLDILTDATKQLLGKLS